MARVLLIVALVLTVFWVYTIVDCAVQPAHRHRGVSKPIWILIVLLIPVLGGLLWLTIGRVRASVVATRVAPDDDPDFFTRRAATSDQDERIRRLEEELAQLDAEGDDPRWSSDGQKPAADVDPTPPVDGEDDGRGQRGAVG
ncbi:PLD nuclease N-terminal domain-containing protein [Microbacterium lemovicicum]|uniref:PLD nuclease N-terminal domain-containing protein n=1 Tax=Microbacterium lemovicicum TaxID=1072463 RepID=UPI000F8E15B1|nr:PLD nuclease N-terminal domain-containing protein [Microbacterium lemovicicum]